MQQAGCSSVAGRASWDRGRIGERLQATLAGLQELHLLRCRQQTLVARALAMDPTPYRGQTSEEQRLESSLSALKEQLSRLRRQDVGLKSHLDQLDQQISELKLDVKKTSSEHLDSDSRPSSGFYELSDGGSGSLSNSCTSVYSESMSSSHGSLLPCTQQLRPRLSVFDYRPRSADETTVGVAATPIALQRQGSHLRDGCRIRTSAELPVAAARLRTRPVSTGDLERLIPLHPGLQKNVDLQSVSSLCHGGGIQHHIVDPKYQQDLVSRRSSDVYPYPSPLHAVALQSPLFSVIGESQEMESSSPPSQVSPNVLKLNGVPRTRSFIETSPGGYISKLMQLSRFRASSQTEGSFKALEHQPPITPQRLSAPPTSKILNTNSSGPLESQVGCCEASHAHPSNLRKDMVDIAQQKPVNVAAVAPQKPADVTKSTEPKSALRIPPTPFTTNDTFCGRSKASGVPSNVPRKHCSGKGSSSSLETCSQESSREPLPLPVKAVLPMKVSKKPSILKPLKVSQGPVAHTEFVLAHFVPAECNQVNSRVHGSKTKSTKVKRRNSEKALRPSKPLPCLERPKGLNIVTKLSGAEWTHANRHGGKILARRPTFIGEVAGRSCSESSLYPVHLRIPHTVKKTELYRTSGNALNSIQTVNIDTSTKRKYRKWQSSVEISARARFANVPSSFVAGGGPPRQPVRKASVLRTVSLRARSRFAHPSTYAKSESEYSAECASLFHSTIVETSEDEVSNYTTNRFGDSESSESESDGGSSSSSLTLDSDMDEGELVWAETSIRLPVGAQTCARARPEPKICRIKASKALKKKIRRFQPASLKVMTMV